MARTDRLDRLFRSGALAASLFLLAAATAAPAAAGTLASADWAWATVRSGTGDTSPSGKDAGSSSGSNVASDRLGTGSYEVTFYGVQSDGSDLPSAALVSPLGGTGRTCATDSWVKSGPNEVVAVRCQTLAGVPVDSPFVVSWLEADGIGGRLGYGWNHSPTAVCATATGYSSADAAIDTCPSGGFARTIFRTIGVAGGIALVTTQDVIDLVGGGYATNCSLGGWRSVLASDRHDEVVDIRCWNTAGDPEPAQRHEVVFLKGLGLKGVVRKNVAYLAARRPTRASYVPATADRYSSSGGRIAVRRLGVGRYEVSFAAMPLGGAAQVSVLGAAARRACTVASIRKRTLPQRVRISCFDGAGAPRDTRFTLAYER